MLSCLGSVGSISLVELERRSRLDLVRFGRVSVIQCVVLGHV